MPINIDDKLIFLETFSVFISVVRQYQYILLDKKIYTRGGISIGNHIETPNYIFSNALISAYEIETKRSIYPRIVLDQKLFEIVSESILSQDDKVKNEILSLYSNKLIRDWDDEIFLSPLGIESEQERLKDYIGLEEFKKIIGHSLDTIKDIDRSEVDLYIDNLGQTHTTQLAKILIGIEDELRKKPNPEVAGKYLWLKQLTLWNINPELSKIKFECVLPEIFKS